jgi:hypothetical protein
MDDIIPTLAFGDGSSQSQIFLYNHADYRFWVGASLPAKFLELRKWGQSLSFHSRGISKSQIIGIPTDPTSVITDAARSKARNELGLNEGSKLILTVGNSKKYIDFAPTSFPQLVSELLKGHPDRIFIGVGPRISDNRGWRDLLNDFPNRVKIIPEVPASSLALYLDAADLGLDSYPLNGGNIAWEMLGRGTPYLTLLGVGGHTDEVTDSEFCFEGRREFIEGANKVLLASGTSYREDAIELHTKVMRAGGPEAWREKMLAIVSQDAFADPFELTVPDLKLLDLYLVAEAGWRENLLS